MLRILITAPLAAAVVAFYTRFLIALCKDLRPRRAPRFPSNTPVRKIKVRAQVRESQTPNQEILVEMEGATLNLKHKQSNVSAAKWKLYILALLPMALLSAKQAVAQTPEVGKSNSRQEGSQLAVTQNAFDQPNAEILQELQAMRARIQELESRLKNRPTETKAS